MFEGELCIFFVEIIFKTLFSLPTCFGFSPYLGCQQADKRFVLRAHVYTHKIFSTWPQIFNKNSLRNGLYTQRTRFNWEWWNNLARNWRYQKIVLTKVGWYRGGHYVVSIVPLHVEKWESFKDLKRILTLKSLPFLHLQTNYLYHIMPPSISHNFFKNNFWYLKFLTRYFIVSNS